MIVLALVVGAITAWYLGIRIGVYAAIGSAVALLAAMFVPGASLPIYALLGLWLAGLWLVKSKLPTLGKPKEPEKKGWEKELDRWKKRATWLWKSARK
jgi:hypothetical protein